MTFLSAGLFVPMIYLDDYLEAQGKTGGALLIGIIGATSVIGRLALGAVGAKVDLMGLYQSCRCARRKLCDLDFRWRQLHDARHLRCMHGHCFMAVGSLSPPLLPHTCSVQWVLEECWARCTPLRGSVD